VWSKLLAVEMIRFRKSFSEILELADSVPVQLSGTLGKRKQAGLVESSGEVEAVKKQKEEPELPEEEGS
jgi:hypothetical protein